MRRFTVASVLSLLAVLMPADSFGQQVPPEIIDEKHGVIEVTASATVQYEPDRAHIGFAVTSFAETASAATEASAVKMKAIQDQLNGMGVGKGQVRTSAFRLNPHYPSDPETRRQQPQPDGYTAFNMVDVTLRDVRSVGSVIDAVIGAGADNVSNLRFTLEDMTPVHREALNKMGVGTGHVRTSAFRLDPHYPTDPETRRQQPQPDGYTAFNMVEVTLQDVRSVGNVIDAVIGAGADNVSNLRFSLEDMSPVHREALKIAFENAEDQAATLASAAGKYLGALLAIRTPPQFQAGPLVQAEVAFARATPTPIEPGTLSHTTSIQVVFEIR